MIGLPLATACSTADIDSRPDGGRDAGGPADTGTRPDVPGAPDTGPTDGGPSDVGPLDAGGPGTVIFEDDFQGSNLGVLWDLVHGTFSLNTGVLVSSNGCAEGTCMAGPGILCTRAAFPVAEGVLSVEYDFWVEGTVPGQSRTRIWLQDAELPVGYSPAGVFTDRDLLLEISQDTSDPTAFIATWAVDRMPGTMRFADLLGSVLPSTWHHARVRTCRAAGASARVARGPDSSSSDSPTALDLPVPPIDTFRVCLVTDGMGHQFDNFEIVRGCLGPRP